MNSIYNEFGILEKLISEPIKTDNVILSNNFKKITDLKKKICNKHK